MQKLLSLIMLVSFIPNICRSEFPSQLAKFTVSSYIGPTKQIQMQLDIVTPKSPNTYPAILFVSGVQSLTPSYFHSKVIDSVAQNGYVWMTVSRFTSPNPQKITHALTHVMDWINQNLQFLFKNKVPGVMPDLRNRLGLIGHSAGGHVSTSYLNNTCGNVKLQILIDPVDGADPLGIKKDFIIVPGQYLPYTVPVLVLRTQLDSKSKVITDPPCAPANLSNQRFYNAMRGPRWFLNVSKYGHADFYDQKYRQLAAAICATCHKECNYTQYRQLIKQVIINFSSAIFNKNRTALNIIEQGKFKIQTFAMHQYNGFDPMNGAFCRRYNSFPTYLKNYQKIYKNLKKQAEQE